MHLVCFFFMGRKSSATRISHSFRHHFLLKRKTSFFLLNITVVDVVVLVECPTVVIQIHHADGAVAAAANVGVGGVVLDCYC